jgi:hypothetical protein
MPLLHLGRPFVVVLLPVMVLVVHLMPTLVCLLLRRTSPWLVLTGGTVVSLLRRLLRPHVVAVVWWTCRMRRLSRARVRRRACHGSASPRSSSRGRGRHGSGRQAAALEPPHGTCLPSIHHIAPF